MYTLAMEHALIIHNYREEMPLKHIEVTMVVWALLISTTM